MTTMAKNMYLLLLSATAFLMFSCNNVNKSRAVNNEHIEAENFASPARVEVQKAEDRVVEEKEVKENTNNSSFDDVEIWKITLTAVTTIFEPVSAEEAKKIEAANEEDYWVDYDEDEKQWFVHGHEMVEVGNVTVTNARWVKRLNQLMQKSEYNMYREDVTIRGKVAYAKWYEGNRGGGIEEDFPKDVAKYINSLRH